MKHVLMATIAATVLASAAAHADPYMPGEWQERQVQRERVIYERESRVGQWIQHGVDEGAMTPREARRLYRELGYVRQKQHSFEADGRLDRREFAELNDDLDRIVARLRIAGTYSQGGYYRQW